MASPTVASPTVLRRSSVCRKTQGRSSKLDEAPGLSIQTRLYVNVCEECLRGASKSRQGLLQGPRQGSLPPRPMSSRKPRSFLRDLLGMNPWNESLEESLEFFEACSAASEPQRSLHTSNETPPLPPLEEALSTAKKKISPNSAPKSSSAAPWSSAHFQI
eukprot:CAMPEP_0171529022 /NCGR_PEP_ID=MMETSP0959-20130129/12082_1 /TAXON_ID=87120 /ORGANISM="Aurantiochytrium limacinum, Strain ATCCMYA-1381" /LENGTH=159 /DNA_ID=CAMNT_0012071239 /DNA_START=541 /DNA_END=1021 /DNA_ORIENTATION=+